MTYENKTATIHVAVFYLGDTMIYNLESRMKPLLKWAGGKTKLIPEIVKYFPETCKTYIEPFTGGGAVFCVINEDIPAILNDTNFDVINLYYNVQNNLDQFHCFIEGYDKQYSREFYYQLREKETDSIVEKAARMLFLNKAGFNGLYRVNSKGKINTPFGTLKHKFHSYQFDNLLRWNIRLNQQVTMTILDFEDIINRAEAGDLIYGDPPYEPVSKTSFTKYTKQGFTQEDQIRLKNACQRAVERGVWIVLSNSKCDFILDLYKDWEIHTVLARRNINSKSDGRDPVEEVIIVMHK